MKNYCEEFKKIKNEILNNLFDTVINGNEERWINFDNKQDNINKRNPLISVYGHFYLIESIYYEPEEVGKRERLVIKLSSPLHGNDFTFIQREEKIYYTDLILEDLAKILTAIQQ